MPRRKRPEDEADFGGKDAAHDGEPADVPGGTAEGGQSAEDDELARKRATRKDGGAIGDRPEPEPDDEQPEELFPVGSLEGDPKMTLGKLIKPHHKVEYTVSLMAAEVPLRGGLLDPDATGAVMITYEVANLTPVPIREDRGGVKKLVGWKIRQSLRPIYVEPIEATKAGDAAAS